jgi:hypothetical protein
MMRIQAYAETQKGRTFVALSLYEAVSANIFCRCILLRLCNIVLYTVQTRNSCRLSPKSVSVFQHSDLVLASHSIIHDANRTHIVFTYNASCHTCMYATHKPQESLRGLLHISLDAGCPLVPSNSNVNTVPAAAVSLRLTNGVVVDTSIGYTQPAKYQLSIAEQCYRFIDSEVKYGDTEIDMLLRYVMHVACHSK